MNSQIVVISDALKSKAAFIFLTLLVPLSLFLKAGFISVCVIWFFVLCIFNRSTPLARQFKLHYILLFPVFFYFLYVFAIGYSDDLQTAINITIRKIHLFLLPLAFIVVDKKVSDKNLNIILSVFLAVCLFSSFVCVFLAFYNIVTHKSNSFQGDDQSYHYLFDYLLANPLKIQPVYLSMFYSFALLITFTTTIIRNGVLKICIVFYLTALIVLLNSNAGIISVIIIIIIWLLTKTRRRGILYGIICMITITALVAVYKSAYLRQKFLSSFIFNYTNEDGSLANSQSNKLVIWDAAIETIKKGPAQGYGPGDAQSALEETYERNGLINEKKDALNAHNEFLSTALETGIVGFAVLTTMLIVPLVIALSTKNKLAAGFIVVMVIFFCVESVLTRQKGLVFFSFFYALLFSQLQASKN